LHKESVTITDMKEKKKEKSVVKIIKSMAV
jgi:hypothetical protein